VNPSKYLSRSEWLHRESLRERDDVSKKEDIERRRRRVLESEETVYEGQVDSRSLGRVQKDELYQDHLDHCFHYHRKYDELIRDIDLAQQNRKKTMTQLYDQLENLEGAENRDRAAIQELKGQIAEKLTHLDY
jgi:hypothetical protein